LAFERARVVYLVHPMNITVYSTPTCPYCKLVKEFLAEHKIKFNDIDVASDTAAANKMVKLSGQMGVPVIDIDGQVIVGWNKGALEEAIGVKVKA
jgi:glutaredoxin 3